MSDASNVAKHLRERLSVNTEERLGKALSDLLENPLITGAVGRAFDARERASQAQEVAMGALNIPSAADIERLTRRLRAVSHRLEGIEDGVQRLDRALSPSAVEARLSAIEDQLGKLAGRFKVETGRPARAAAAAKTTRSKSTGGKVKTTKAKAAKPAKAKAASKAKAATKAKATAVKGKAKAAVKAKAKTAAKAKARTAAKAKAAAKAKPVSKAKAGAAKAKAAGKAKAKTAGKAASKAKAAAGRSKAASKAAKAKPAAKSRVKAKSPAKAKAKAKAAAGARKAASKPAKAKARRS
ncbi:MAG TPA: hypothetical protein VGI52_05985 [Solirubrobacteraceae bacterium]